MDTKVAETVQTSEPEKKSSADVKIWIVIVSIYLLVCMAAAGFGAWVTYTIFKTIVEKNNTPYAAAAALAGWPVLMSDDFGKVSETWYVGTYSGQDYTETRSITDGVYAWEISSAEGYTFWQNAGFDNLSDFVLSVDVRHTSGSPYDGYGLEFRQVAQNHYLFSIQDNGVYTLHLYSAGKWNEIIAPTVSTAIRPEKFNHLTVQAQGTHFQLFINDTYVNEYEDGTLTLGDVGMMFSPAAGNGNPSPGLPQGIGYSRSSDVSRVIFDNFEVRAPQGVSVANSLPQPPQIRPAPGRLVFTSNRGGDRNIYTINTDGDGLEQLTADPAADYTPRWSPDGKKIAFVSRRDGNAEVYIMDANGSNLARLTNNPAEDISPDWSPDGKQIIFSSRRKSNFDIYLMSALGEKDRLLQLTTAKYDEINPSISPDGLEVLYQARKNIIYRPMLMSIKGNNIKEIQTYYPDRTAADSAWAPDGLQIAYVEKGLETQQIIIMDDAHRGFGEYSELTQNMGISLYPNWAPNREQVVFVSDMAGQADIYIIRADGSGIFRVKETEALEESPDWTNP